MRHDTGNSGRLRGLYVITAGGPDDSLPDAVESALAGGASIVQLRDKRPAGDSEKRHLAEKIVRLCRHFTVPFIVNDDVELAESVRADGVHLGEHDALPSHARAVLGPQAMVGISCYNDLNRALRAQEQGADYVAFGRFYPSQTKPTARLADRHLLKQAVARLHIPIVAIGGITSDNAQSLIQCGADAVAVSHDVFACRDIAAACRAYLPLFS